MTARANIVTGGFSDHVFDSQHIFRALMDGMARPGSHQSFELPIRPPAPLNIAAGGILLTLCDHDTPVWLSSVLARSLAPSWLSFHTGATQTQEKADARFAVAELGSALSSFDLFAHGTQEYPDRSATLLIEVPDFESGPAMQLTGPGIRNAEIIRPSGLPDLFVRLWSENRAGFPRGVDVILTCGNRFLCLPRSTCINLMEA